MEELGFIPSLSTFKYCLPACLYPQYISQFILQGHPPVLCDLGVTSWDIYLCKFTSASWCTLMHFGVS